MSRECTSSLCGVVVGFPEWGELDDMEANGNNGDDLDGEYTEEDDGGLSQQIGAIMEEDETCVLVSSQKPNWRSPVHAPSA